MSTVKRPRIELLVGMIASGKSTYARRRADEGALVVCHDDLTAMLHARYRYEPEKRALYRRLEEAIAFEALAGARHLDGGCDVVIDRTHLTRESRERWLSFARWPRFAEWATPEIIAVAFPIEAPEVHARRRFECDGRGRPYEEWLAVARHHAEQAAAEPVSVTEGFHDVIFREHVER